LQAAH